MINFLTELLKYTLLNPHLNNKSDNQLAAFVYKLNAYYLPKSNNSLTTTSVT